MLLLLYFLGFSNLLVSNNIIAARVLMASKVLASFSVDFK
jgi:hypothetical protein